MANVVEKRRQTRYVFVFLLLSFLCSALATNGMKGRELASSGGGARGGGGGGGGGGSGRGGGGGRGGTPSYLHNSSNGCVSTMAASGYNLVLTTLVFLCVVLGMSKVA